MLGVRRTEGTLTAGDVALKSDFDKSKLGIWDEKFTWWLGYWDPALLQWLIHLASKRFGEHAITTGNKTQERHYEWTNSNQIWFEDFTLAASCNKSNHGAEMRSMIMRPIKSMPVCAFQLELCSNLHAAHVIQSSHICQCWHAVLGHDCHSFLGIGILATNLSPQK